MISDSLLAERMAAGDQEAFELLVTRYHGPLLSYVTSQLRDRGKAEDIVQETFIRLIRHLKRHGGMEQLRPWLYKVALNLCRDYWRSASYRSEYAGTDTIPEDVDPAPRAEELIERQEAVEQLVESITQLPEVQQDVVRMRFFHDLKLQEIAELLELPLSSVKSHLYGGLRKLKRALARSADHPVSDWEVQKIRKEESEVPTHGTLH
ncbi:MAG: RNA polymerase sigma factor [Paenibacillus sp.]|uniref:RNA polymerase sigma factor n=1 Tax=Paenibacillus sp. TaxID=58172 RepID=UPI002901CDAF|nr:RNA polymerase sigma factor [Paenibacillus sp.]MDU2240842.1 RNA polymerase sigma factor [Paenibacillus sp.]